MGKRRRKGERGGEVTGPSPEAPPATTVDEPKPASPPADISEDITKIDKPKPATRKVQVRKVSR